MLPVKWWLKPDFTQGRFGFRATNFTAGISLTEDHGSYNDRPTDHVSDDDAQVGNAFVTSMGFSLH